MSDSGGFSIGIAVGAGVGGCALIVGVIAMVIFCYMKARKEKANSNMTKSHDVFSTAASNNQFDYPQRSRVNQYPDPAAARKARQKERGRDTGHLNPAYSRHASDSSSIGSDVEGRDLSPPRVRRPRGGPNGNFSSESSYEDSSSVDDDVIPGSFSMEREVDDKNKRGRSSYKKSRQNDILDPSDRTDNSRHRRTDGESHRVSRRDEFQRNPRSDSPLTIGSLKKHEQITQSGDKWDDKNNRSSKGNKSKRREASPSRTYESSEITQTSLTTEGTMTTMSSGQRFVKNPSLRRNSPSRSSSHRRYRKDHETDSHGRRKPRRTRSKDRDHRDGSDRHSDRSRSPGSGSQRSSSSRGSRRSRASSASEAKRIAQGQAMLPIFQDSKKKSSAV